LDPADGGTVRDRGLADGARNVAREVGDVETGGLQVGRDLEQADAVLRQREHERRVRKGQRAHERLDVEAVGDLDLAREVVRQPERDARGRVDEEREAARLVAPELVVVDEVGDLLFDRGDVLLVNAGLAQLPRGFAAQVLQLDPLRLAARGRRGRQVDRDARRPAGGQEPLQLGTRRDVGGQDHRSVDPGEPKPCQTTR